MIEHCRFEYSRELLNSNCDFCFIGNVLHRVNEIKLKILKSVGFKGSSELNKTKKMVYDFTSNCNPWKGTIIPDSKSDVELSWKFAMDLIVKDLKKIFPDSKVYCENKEIYDIHDKVTIHRLIVVDWN